MTNEKIYNMAFAKIFPLLIAKTEKKGRTRSDSYGGYERFRGRESTRCARGRKPSLRHDYQEGQAERR